MLNMKFKTSVFKATIATKADKIGTTKQQENMQVITKVLFAKENIIPFSSSNKLNLDIIENIILENIH